VTHEEIKISELKMHPQNYRKHPEDQLVHIEASLRRHGFYRPVVVARDMTILAGHGVVEAAIRVGLEVAPVVRLDLDPDSPPALKILAGDNEVGRMADVDDRALSELLRGVAENDLEGLLGTGFDDAALSALVMVTRPKDEIEDFSAAQHWTGMPEFDAGSEQILLTISFRNRHDRDSFIERAGISGDDCSIRSDGRVWSAWWPPMEKSDRSSVRFEEAKA
jgi:hypothetical protein